MNKIFAPFLPPWAETGLQPAFYDVESGTVLQQTARMYDKVNQLTRLFNEFSESVTNEVNTFEDNIDGIVDEYIEKFNQLHDYVYDYFENLDVQEEIDHKLDEMAENGTLEEIVSRYFEHIVITPLQFGAKGDGVTDDTESFQDAVDFAISNGVSLFVPDGTYLVSKLSIDDRINMYGNGVNSVIKSIDSNSEDSIIYLVNAGIKESSIHDLAIDGNKSNNSNNIDGIKLYIDNSSYVGDLYTNLYNLKIVNASGNGIHFESNQTSAFREMRLDNIVVNSCNGNGFYIDKTTDSIFTRCTSAGNRLHGFYVPTGGSNKFTDCKAFWCGGGDGTTVEDGNRIPYNAFTETSDVTPQLDKLYYTRSGTNVENDYYEFTRFTGESFDGGTTYYELTTFYPKRYAGFYVSATASFFSNCESQENFGDGFVITAAENKMSNVSADNNGLLTVSGNPVSYASQSKTQLYYGIYVTGWQFFAEGCCFLNHLNSSVGKHQKAGVYFRGGGFSTVRGTQSNQVVETITIQKVSNPLTLSATLNGVEWLYNMPTSTYLLMNTGFELDDTDNNYLYYQNGYIYYRLCVKKSDDSGILNGTTAVKLFNFQAGCRPYTNTRLNGVAYSTDDNGYLINGVVTNFIYTWGDCEVNYIDTSLNTKKQIIVTGSYKVKTS